MGVIETRFRSKDQQKVKDWMKDMTNDGYECEGIFIRNGKFLAIATKVSKSITVRLKTK